MSDDFEIWPSAALLNKPESPSSEFYSAMPSSAYKASSSPRVLCSRNFISPFFSFCNVTLNMSFIR